MGFALICVVGCFSWDELVGLTLWVAIGKFGICGVPDYVYLSYWSVQYCYQITYMWVFQSYKQLIRF